MKIRYLLLLAVIFCVACSSTQDIEPVNPTSSEDTTSEVASDQNEVEDNAEEHGADDHSHDDDDAHMHYRWRQP